MNQKIFFTALFLCVVMLACGGGTPPQDNKKTEIPAKKQDDGASDAEKMVKLGANVYKQFCISCHGADGKLGVNGAGDLTASELPEADVVNIITKGKGLMTPYQELLSEKQIKAVAAHVIAMRGGSS